MAASIFLLLSGPVGISSDITPQRQTWGQPSPNTDRAALISMAKQVSKKDWRILAAIMKVESGYRSDAISKKGAVGVMQVRPSVWAKDLVEKGIITHRSDLHQPQDNIRAGHYILTTYRKQARGDIRKALTRYSGGAKKYADRVLKAYKEEHSGR